MVPTTFHGISKDSAMITSTADARQPLAGMDRASKMPSGISMASTASEKPIWRNKAPCSSSSCSTAANHSVPTKTRRSGAMMSCTE
ncbi:hypothetical protein D3C71_1460050 [compost metagenome]